MICNMILGCNSISPERLTASRCSCMVLHSQGCSSTSSTLDNLSEVFPIQHRQAIAMFCDATNSYENSCQLLNEISNARCQGRSTRCMSTERQGKTCRE